MIEVLVGVVLSMVAIVALCGGFEEERSLPVDPRRDHRSEVRSDCRSWLIGHVRDQDRLRRIADLGRRPAARFCWLEERLRAFGVEGRLSALRWRRIAERRREPPLPEPTVVEEFLIAARELVA